MSTTQIIFLVRLSVSSLQSYNDSVDADLLRLRATNDRRPQVTADRLSLEPDTPNRALSFSIWTDAYY